ncbi:MAG: hypothetical protein J6Y35_03885 [Bacteroidales bacterium]|nr:hypothetical protein [Bacteroidales bacterium]
MKDSTIIIIAVVGFVLFRMYQKGLFSSTTYAGGDKYTQYANALQGLANNATGNFLAVHSGISQGINDQINTSVNTALGAVTNWAQMSQDNKNRNDQREFDQFQQILATI